MKSFSILVIILCKFVCLCYSCPKEQVPNHGHYSTKYDDIDMDEILANERSVNQYVRCLLQGKPCSAPGCFLRVILPDALKTKCSKCTEKQKGIAMKFFQTVPIKYPEEWKKLINKWDPTGKLSKDLRDALSSSRSSSAVELPDLHGASSSRSGNPVELPDLRDATSPKSSSQVEPTNLHDASSSRSSNAVGLPDLRGASSSRSSNPVTLPDVRDATPSSRSSSSIALPIKGEKNNEHSSQRKNNITERNETVQPLLLLISEADQLLSNIVHAVKGH